MPHLKLYPRTLADLKIILLRFSYQTHYPRLSASWSILVCMYSCLLPGINLVGKSVFPCHMPPHQTVLVKYEHTPDRHAKSREPGNLVPGHFWRKIQTFFRNQIIKEINLRFCCGFMKKQFKWMPVSLHFYSKHHYMYSYNPLVYEFA